MRNILSVFQQKYTKDGFRLGYNLAPQTLSKLRVKHQIKNHISSLRHPLKKQVALKEHL